MAESTKIAKRRRVYVHCRPIFSGDNALVRTTKRIKALVDGNRASLKPLLNDMTEQQVMDILRHLLDRRIFESEARAKVEFPDLFRPPSVRDTQRQAFEDDAARSTEEAWDSIASCQKGSGSNSDQHGAPQKEPPKKHTDPPKGHDEPPKKHAEHGEPPNEHGEPRKEHGEPPKKHDEPPKVHDEPVKSVNGGEKVEPLARTETGLSRHNLPSLYPSYLPYQTQHLILTTVQQALEECCFEFATAAMPSVLQKAKLECPMAVELNKWTELFRKGKTRAFLSNDSQDFESKEVQETLTAVSHLRHTAVHRLHITARAISQLLDAAVNLAETLQDNLRAAQLDELRFDINIQIKAMELSKNVLEDTVSAELQKIQQKREELERMETELIRTMLDDDKNNKTLVGSLLEDSVRRVFKRKRRREGYEQEKEDEKQENDKEGGREERKMPEHEASDEDSSSGYETPAEEKFGDID